MKDKTVLYIGIDGHGGSGKSTLADLLSRELGAQVIRIDDFTGPDSGKYWHHELISRVFTPIRNGAKTLSYQPVKWWPEHHPEPVVDQPVTPIMILEGVRALSTELRPFMDFAHAHSVLWAHHSCASV